MSERCIRGNQGEESGGERLLDPHAHAVSWLRDTKTQHALSMSLRKQGHAANRLATIPNDRKAPYALIRNE